MEALALLVLGKHALLDPYQPRIWILTWAVGLAVLVALDWRLERDHDHTERQRILPAAPVLSWRRWALLGLLALPGYELWTQIQDHAGEIDPLLLLGGWAAMLAFAIAVAAWPYELPTRTKISAQLRANWQEVVIVGGLIVGAFLLRHLFLESHAVIFSGDEGKFALNSREILDGVRRNPFETTFDGQVSLWLFPQAAVMYLFGDDITGARSFSGFLGTATVLLFYLLIRRHFGMPTALVSASMLAVFHFHLFVSRDALNNVSSAFFAVLVLLFIDLFISTWRPGWAMALGVTLGLAQYSYVSNRLLVPVTIFILGAALLLLRPRARQDWIAAGQGMLLATSGFVLTVLPIAAYYTRHRDTLNGRLNAVSVFGSGWLEAEKQRRGVGALPILWQQFEQAALFPFRTFPSGYYLVNPPFIGWLWVVPAAIGIAIITCNFFRRRYLAYAVLYWAVVVGLSLTIGIPESNRFAMGAFLMPLTAAIGITRVGALLRRYIGVPRTVIWALLAGFVALSAIWNVRVAFDMDPAVNIPPDRNSTAVNQFGRQMSELGPGYTVYFGAAPRMFYGGLPNLMFLAKGDTGIDLLEPLTPADTAPVLTQPTIFFFLPERREEVAVVQSWFPDGELVDHVSESGVPLYTTYLVRPPVAQGGPSGTPVAGDA